MSFFLVLAILLVHIAPGSCEAEATNPIQKVLELLDQMQQEIIEDGEARQKAYVQISGMCKDRSSELSHEIKLHTSQIEDDKATIEKAGDDEDETTTEIGELSSVLSSSADDLKAASQIRQKEAGDFAEAQKDLIETISQMERAISIIEKQQKENRGASFAQLPISVQKGARQVQKQRAAALAEAFSAMIDSSSLDSADTQKLTFLIQASEGDTDSEAAADTKADAAELDAAEASYSNRGAPGPENAGSIVETLENLLEKAQAQLELARATETKATNNFELFKASLERKMAQSQKGMNEAKHALGEARETRADAEGFIEVRKKDLAEDVALLNLLHHQCMSKATEYEQETTSRAEELKALAVAMKVIKETTGAAEKDTYDDVSQVFFLQARSQSTSGSSPEIRAVKLVRDLGESQKMPSLLEMAHKMESLVRNSVISGADPFEKVRTMISTMLDHLTREMQTEASHKDYCDREMRDAKKSKGDKEHTEDKVQTLIDTQKSKSMQLRREVGVLQQELLYNMKTQQEMDKIRKKEAAHYAKTKPQLQMGQEGIQKALQVLREYYSQDDDKSHETKDGAGAGIISMLEVVESDFVKSLVSMEEEDAAAKAAYEKQTEENKISKAVKHQDVLFYNKNIKRLEKVVSESSTDLDSVETELEAVNKYYAMIQVECAAKPVPYEERRKRQEVTVQGLQDAMEILQGSTALLQQGQELRQLRGKTSEREDELGDHAGTFQGADQDAQDF